MNAVLGRRALTLLALSALLLGCATSQESQSGPEACVIVNNETGSGTHSRIFLVSAMSGWRLGMGEVGMGRTLRYCTRRVTSPERVQIIIERPSTAGTSSLNSGRNRIMVSPNFVLRLDEIWTWNLELNRMSRSIVIR